MKPARYQRWLNPDVENLAELNQQVKAVCKLYEEAPQLHAQGTHVISTDEMTGIQALERPSLVSFNSTLSFFTSLCPLPLIGDQVVNGVK